MHYAPPAAAGCGRRKAKRSPDLYSMDVETISQAASCTFYIIVKGGRVFFWLVRDLGSLQEIELVVVLRIFFSNSIISEYGRN